LIIISHFISGWLSYEVFPCRCSKAAGDILQQVNDLNQKLSDARAAQNDSREAINQAQQDILDTKAALKQVQLPIGPTMLPRLVGADGKLRVGSCVEPA